MSDFLTRLAARELGQAPVLEPRIRALFEPDAGDRVVGEPTLPRLAPDARPHEDRTDVRTPELPAHPPVEPPPESPPPRPLVRARAPAAIQNTTSPPLLPDEHSHDDRRLPVERDSLRIDTPEPGSAPAHPREARTERTLTPPHHSVSVSTPVQKDGAARPHRSERSQALPPGRTVPVELDLSRVSAKPVLSNAPLDRRAPPRLVHGRVRIGTDGPLATRALDSSRPSPVPIPQAVDTPIHVSIGRIEVTAVTNAPRAKEKAKARPRASLDDYLAQRRRGSR